MLAVKTLVRRVKEPQTLAHRMMSCAMSDAKTATF
jgi:hypothetical protein